MVIRSGGKHWSFQVHFLDCYDSLTPCSLHLILMKCYASEEFVKKVFGYMSEAEDANNKGRSLGR